jgi:hypothetical protein
MYRLIAGMLGLVTGILGKLLIDFLLNPPIPLPDPITPTPAPVPPQPQPQPQPIPPTAPAPVPVPDPNPNPNPNPPPLVRRLPRLHLSLGVEANNRLAQFTINLNILLNPQGISVHAFITAFGQDSNGNSMIIPDWADAGLAGYAGALAMPTAARNAEAIHFNLEGLPQDYIQSAIEAGADLTRPPFTSSELYIIMNDQTLCAKTDFYLQGSILPVPSLEAKVRICGFINTLPSP